MTDMYECPVCGTMNYQGQKYCGGCRELLKYYCPNCNTVVDQTQTVCPGCGAEFNWPESRETGEVSIVEAACGEQVSESHEGAVDMAAREEKASAIQAVNTVEEPGKGKTSIGDTISSVGASLGGYLRGTWSTLSNIQLGRRKKGVHPVVEDGGIVEEEQPVTATGEPEMAAGPEIPVGSEQPWQVNADESRVMEEEAGPVPEVTEARPDTGTAEQVYEQEPVVMEQVEEEEKVIEKKDTVSMKARIAGLGASLGAYFSGVWAKLSDVKLSKDKKETPPVIEGGEVVVEEQPVIAAGEPEMAAGPEIPVESEQPLQVNADESRVMEEEAGSVPAGAEVQSDTGMAEQVYEQEPVVMEQVEEEEKVIEKKDTVSMKARTAGLGASLGAYFSGVWAKLSNVKLSKDKKETPPVIEVDEDIVAGEPVAVAEVAPQEERVQPAAPPYVDAGDADVQVEKVSGYEVLPPSPEIVEQPGEEQQVEIESPVIPPDEVEIFSGGGEETVPFAEVVISGDEITASRHDVPVQEGVIVCYYHPDRIARHTCPRCGQPVCRECYGIRNGELQCWNCYRR